MYKQQTTPSQLSLTKPAGVRGPRPPRNFFDHCPIFSDFVSFPSPFPATVLTSKTPFPFSLSSAASSLWHRGGCVWLRCMRIVSYCHSPRLNARRQGHPQLDGCVARWHDPICAFTVTAAACSRLHYRPVSLSSPSHRPQPHMQPTERDLALPVKQPPWA